MAVVGADRQRTGSIVQQAAPIDGGGPSDIGSGWRPRTRAAGSQEAEGRCTLGEIAMCNVQRTCGCFQTTGDERMPHRGSKRGGMDSGYPLPSDRLGQVPDRQGERASPAPGDRRRQAATGRPWRTRVRRLAGRRRRVAWSMEHGAWSVEWEWQWGVGSGEWGESSVE
jgi:hypothetical protein